MISVEGVLKYKYPRLFRYSAYASKPAIRFLKLLLYENTINDFMQKHLIAVDNITGKLSRESLNQITESLNSEEAVIFFPSGEVSYIYLNRVRDEKWKSGFVKFSKRTQSPILPIYIKQKTLPCFMVPPGYIVHSARSY